MKPGVSSLPLLKNRDNVHLSQACSCLLCNLCSPFFPLSAFLSHSSLLSKMCFSQTSYYPCSPKTCRGFWVLLILFFLFEMICRSAPCICSAWLVLPVLVQTSPWGSLDPYPLDMVFSFLEFRWSFVVLPFCSHCLTLYVFSLLLDCRFLEGRLYDLTFHPTILSTWTPVKTYW